MRNRVVVVIFLIIAGAASAARINFTAGNAAVADDVNANFIELYTLNPTSWTNTASNLGYTGGNLGVGIASPLAKFQVNGGSAITLAGATGFGVFGATTGNHVAIDSTQIQAKSNATTAANLAINPLGGNVGIGFTSPTMKLVVSGSTTSSIAVHSALDNTAYRGIGYHFIHESSENAYILAQRPSGVADGADLIFQNRPTGGALTSRMVIQSTGEVGIGTASPLTGFHVNVTAPTQALFGSGLANAIRIYPDTEPAMIWDSTTNLRFGTMTAINAGFSEKLRILANGNVGINSASPGAKLEVFDSVSGSGVVVASNVAVFKNSSAGGGADGVMIWLSGEGANTALDGGNNFMTFTVGASPTGVGSIQGGGVGGGGVTLNTTSGDYAEMLPKANAASTFKIGDIVAVDNGRASASVAGSIFMPYSSGPAVLGNSPQDPEISKNYAPLGFVGQVKINVRGPVQNGDFVLASRSESGVGYALNGKKIKPEEFHRVVGRAWESSTDQRVKLINCLVGVPQAYPYQEVATQIQMMSRQKEAELHQQITQLSREVAKANVQKQSDLTLLKNENVQLRSALKAQDLRLAQLEQNLARVAQRLDSKQQTVARR